MINSRKICFDILKKAHNEKVFTGNVLDNALRQMQFSDKRDRAFITRLVEGVTERKLTLDFLIDKFSKGGSKNSAVKKSDIRILLRMGIYQIKYMDSVPDRAAISETVKLAREKGYDGLTGYINGLLSKTSLQAEQIEAMRYQLRRQYGLEGTLWEQYLDFVLCL